MRPRYQSSSTWNPSAHPGGCATVASVMDAIRSALESAGIKRRGRASEGPAMAGAWLDLGKVFKAGHRNAEALVFATVGLSAKRSWSRRVMKGMQRLLPVSDGPFFLFLSFCTRPCQGARA